MSRYFTRVSKDLLPFVRDPANLGRAGLTLVREVRDEGQWSVVEFDDPGAPDAYEGKHVVPTISRRFAIGEEPGADDIWVSDRWVAGEGIEVGDG